MPGTMINRAARTGNKHMMRQIILVGVAVVATQPFAQSARAAGPSPHPPPSKMEAVPGTSLKRITLTEKAAGRLDIQTAKIARDAEGKKIAPYLAIIYDAAGQPWVYLNPGPLTYVREKVNIEKLVGEFAYLTEGPGDDVVVVTVGVAELFGLERGLK